MKFITVFRNLPELDERVSKLERRRINLTEHTPNA